MLPWPTSCHIREEVVATPEVVEGAEAAGAAAAPGAAGAPAEPEVAKKGKGEAEPAAGKKPEAKK